MSLPYSHNLMWLTHSSCDAPPRHSYFGQIQNTATSCKNNHWSPSFTDVKCCESHSLNRTGCVVCCRYAWRQWSSFIHDADYCDNLNTERLLIGHVTTWRPLIGRHDTRHTAPMIRLSPSRSEENLFKKCCQHKYNSVVDVDLKVLTFEYLPWCNADELFFFIHLKYDDSPLQIWSRKPLIFL